MPKIHPSAIVSPEAMLADDVEIGPGCVVSGRVELAAGVRLIGSVYLQGPVVIGERTLVYPGACLGFEPQDYKFRPGCATAGVRIGADCLVREHVTVHASTSEETPTSVGSGCFLMVNSHMGHDSRIEDRVILVNGALLAGHSEVHAGATISGNAAIHQHVRIGRLAFLSGVVGMSMDMPPFCMSTRRNSVDGLNLVGMRRAGIPREEIAEVRRAFRELLRHPLPREELVAELEDRGREYPTIAEIGAFVKASKRGVCSGTARTDRGGVESASEAG